MRSTGPGALERGGVRRPPARWHLATPSSQTGGYTGFASAASGSACPPRAFAAMAAAGIATACMSLGAARAAAPLAAVAVAVIAVLRTGSPQAAILAGMPALWIATALLPS